MESGENVSIIGEQGATFGLLQLVVPDAVVWNALVQKGQQSDSFNHGVFKIFLTFQT